MERHDIIKPLNDGEIGSEILASVIKHHAGEKYSGDNSGAIRKADRVLSVTEVLQKVYPSLWSHCEKIADDFIAEIKVH